MITKNCVHTFTPSGDQLFQDRETGATLLLNPATRRAQVTIGDRVTVHEVSYIEDLGLLIDQMVEAARQLTGNNNPSQYGSNKV